MVCEWMGLYALYSDGGLRFSSVSHRLRTQIAHMTALSQLANPSCCASRDRRRSRTMVVENRFHHGGRQRRRLLIADLSQCRDAVEVRSALLKRPPEPLDLHYDFGVGWIPFGECHNSQPENVWISVGCAKSCPNQFQTPLVSEVRRTIMLSMTSARPRSRKTDCMFGSLVRNCCQGAGHCHSCSSYFVTYSFNSFSLDDYVDGLPLRSLFPWWPQMFLREPSFATAVVH